jgi:AraC-like DNA-binding protein
MKIQIETLADGSELVHYDSEGVPLSVCKGILSYYAGMQAACHWHDDLELICILDGEMNYYVNGTVTVLKKGDGILINTGALHYGYAHEGKECIFTCILFQKSLLSGCTEVVRQYIEPVTQNPEFEFFFIDGTRYPQLTDRIRLIGALKARGLAYDVLQVIGQLTLFWADFLAVQTASPYGNRNGGMAVPDSFRKMLAFIHTHYFEKITLRDIYTAGGVCKSSCCIIFKNQVQMTPLHFVNYYRLYRAAAQLTESTRSITDIAADAGFEQTGYFTKLFRRHFSCTPSEYRKKSGGSDGRQNRESVCHGPVYEQG